MRSSSSSSARSRSATAARAAVWGVGLFGCAFSEAGDPAIPFRRRCDTPAALPCDVAAAGCQAMLFEYAACLRDVPVGSVSRPPVAPVAGLGAVEPRSAAETAELTLLGDGLARFGLHDPALDLGAASESLDAESVLAWYDPQTQGVTLIVPAGKTVADRSTTDINGTLIHEYIHAVQDQIYGLGAFFDTAADEDDVDARRSVVEGEATYFESVGTLGFSDETIWNFAWHDRSHWVDDYVASTLPYLNGALFLPYVAGGRAVEAAWKDAPLDFEAALYGKPARTMASLLSLGPVESTRLLPFGSAAPSPTATGSVRTAIGAIGLEMLLARAGFALATRDALLDTFERDRFAVYAEPDGGPVAIWSLAGRRSSRAALSSALGQAVADLGAVEMTVEDAGDLERVVLAAGGSDRVRAAYVLAALAAFDTPREAEGEAAGPASSVAARAVGPGGPCRTVERVLRSRRP